VTDVRNAQAVLMRPTGPLDADTCGEFRQQLASAFAAGVRAVAVDLAAVTTVDPIGLGVLAGANRHLRRRGGTLVLLHPSPAVATKVRVNGLSELLEIPASPPLRLLAGTGTGTSEDRPRVLSVVPGLKRPS
jgi:anti-anti-sigma factor